MCCFVKRIQAIKFARKNRGGTVAVDIEHCQIQTSAAALNWSVRGNDRAKVLDALDGRRNQVPSLSSAMISSVVLSSLRQPKIRVTGSVFGDFSATKFPFSSRK